ncbi:hypothetical protein JOM56_012276 [Amanita muscaria]
MTFPTVLPRIQEDTQDSSSDWSQLTNALWNSDSDHGSLKLSYPDVLDYTPADPFTMNVDICSFGIEPNMLHFDPTKYQQQSFADVQYPYLSISPGDMCPLSFQAALQQAPILLKNLSNECGKLRESCSQYPWRLISPGTLLLPISPCLPRRYNTNFRYQNSRPHEKAPSPSGSSYASTSSAASTPLPSTPPMSSSSAVDQALVQMQINLSPVGIGPTMGQMSSSRPKTSHTTIERRYRTNLNARIQSLRMAVPALRVLEDGDSSEGKKIKRAVKGGIMVKGLPGATGIVSPGEDGTPQPQKYLLATFALFSFFNSPLTQSYSSPSHHHHQRPRVVLNHPPLAYAPEIVHGLAAFQLIFSVLVLLSMVMSWLRVGVAPQGTSKSWLRRIRSKKVLEINKSSGTDGHKNWLKVGGEMVLKEVSSRSGTLSLYTCFQVGCAVSASMSSPSLEDLCTFSLVLHGTGSFIVNALLRGRSRVMWNRAKVLCASLLRKPGKHVHILAGNVIIPAQLGLDMDQEPSPLTVLGAIAVRDRMKKHLIAAFVKTATADDKIASDVNDNDDNDDEDERQKTFSAASELGGSLAQLGKIAERLCRLVADGRGQMVTVSSDLIESLANRDEQDEVSSLILALVLYQRVFHSHDKGQWTLLSPPPSPGGRSASTGPVFLLKKTLGSGVFDEECVQGLEDARDGTVDLLSKLRGRGDII